MAECFRFLPLNFPIFSDPVKTHPVAADGGGHPVTGADLPLQQLLRRRVLDIVLHRPAQGTGAEFVVMALAGQPAGGVLRHQ